jgi:spore coat polysaccharide biosynthesis protein SpsF
MKNIIAIVQARTGSTRLPAKVFEKIGEYMMLEHVILRLKKSNTLNRICVATTKNPDDLNIIKICQDYNIYSYRGSETDVLSRYKEAADAFSADIVVRITSDCPFIDPWLLDDIVGYFLKSRFDYVSNTIKRTFPRGLGVEVFTKDALDLADAKADKDYEREHVTPFMRENTELFKISNIECNLGDYSNYRITVDTQEDLKLARELYKLLSKKHQNLDYTWKDIIKTLDENPYLVEINKHIKQKSIK